MSTVRFISTDYIKINTPIQENVDSDILLPFILSAQDTHIHQALGTTFYTRLKNGVINNDLNSDELELMRSYIQPCLAQFAFYEVLPHLNYKPTNKAISQSSSEYSQPSALEEIKYLRQSVRDLAEFYLKRLNKYLCDYSSLFPEYENPDDKENLGKSRKSYFTGIYMEKRNSFNNLPSYDEPYEE